jgi:DNA polymerase-3 subunit delta'
VLEFPLRLLREQKGLERLGLVFQKGHIPHAFLLHGEEGTGKRASALLFAMFCNCLRIAEESADALPKDGLIRRMDCGCRSCGKIRSENHPDIHWIEPSGSIIRIDQIRELIRAISMKPYEARTRVVVISSAQAMNPEASNALLKMLEEPPDRTVLLLTAPRVSDLLPTIVSRCQTVAFMPIGREILASFLAEEYDMSDEDARIMAAMGSETLNRIGMGTAGHGKWTAQRQWVADLCLEIMPGRGRAVSGIMALAFAERLFQNKDGLMDVLDLIKFWLRDLIVYRYRPGEIVNKDRAEDISHMAERVSIQDLLRHFRSVELAQKRLQSNANVRLTLEALMLQFAGNAV